MIAWNGVELCAKKVDTRIVLALRGAQKHHICGRAKGHKDKCAIVNLTRSYVPH